MTQLNTNTKDSNFYPAVSSNTLFHFTNKREYLLNILTDNFQPRFCLENLSGLQPDAWLSDLLDFAIPMVCFCDLPLSLTGNHLATYGNYGIGLTKEWGMRKGLNPILYVHTKSSLREALVESETALAFNLKGSPIYEKFIKGQVMLKFFTKPYEGEFIRNGSPIGNVRFYDEKEWRYVPQADNGEFYYKRKNDFLNLIPEERVVSSESATLKFTPDDVRYIVIEKEDEILSMMTELENIVLPKFGEDEVKKLMTRIISAERIREDF